MGAQIEMEILFGGETTDPIARPNRGSIQTLGPVKVKGEARDRWFLGKENLRWLRKIRRRST